ncbi:MAG: laccase domain-containing protein [Gemmatimonadetes bacterium]|nr:laccase domain-containing protein [Gemmatimonadota bacterium]
MAELDHRGPGSVHYTLAVKAGLTPAFKVPLTTVSQVDVVREHPAGPGFPFYVHPEWATRYPWVVQGTTGAGATESPFDLRLFGLSAAGDVLARWALLQEATACPLVVHSRQVHGTAVLVHGRDALGNVPEVPTQRTLRGVKGGPAGLFVTSGHDGHVTRQPGILLTVSVADCVPIFVIAGASKAVALLHGGWRGIAAGILEAGLSTLRDVAGSLPAEVDVHLGPSICGECYEVGPEVHGALGCQPAAGPSPVDLRALLVERALSLGVRRERLSVSAHCTRCGQSPFFSHRAGSPARQMAVLGIRGQRT